VLILGSVLDSVRLLFPRCPCRDAPLDRGGGGRGGKASKRPFFAILKTLFANKLFVIIKISQGHHHCHIIHHLIP